MDDDRGEVDDIMEFMVMGSWGKSNLGRVLCLAVALSFAIVNYFHYSSIFEEKKISNAVYFGGDMWEYHSVGANWSQGKGFVFGNALGMREYKFSIGPGERELRKDDVEKRWMSFSKIRPYNYSAPGYPLFLGLVYKAFGIEPIKAKYANIVLMSLCVFCLILVGYIYFGFLGIFPGAITAWIFSRIYYPDPSVLMSECLLTCLLSIMLLVFSLWDKYRNAYIAAFLGLVCGITMMAKGIVIFVPLFIMIYIGFNTQMSFRKRMAHLALFLTFFLVPKVFWMTYEMSQNPDVQLVERKARRVLLDGNNEDSMKTGQWHPEWEEGDTAEQKYFYNQLDHEKYPAPLLVSWFWIKHWQLVPKAFYYKFRNAFLFKGVQYYYLVFVIGCLFLYLCRNSSAFALPLIYSLNIFLISIIGFGYDRFTLIFLPFAVFIAVSIPFELLKMGLSKLLPKAFN